jgi:hypothetical protein
VCGDIPVEFVGLVCSDDEGGSDLARGPRRQERHRSRGDDRWLCDDPHKPAAATASAPDGEVHSHVDRLAGLADGDGLTSDWA